MSLLDPADAAPTSLWKHGDFNRLWAGQTVSVVGSAVTALALPSLAVLQLHASPFQVGLIAACQRFAFPILALPVGVLADRVSSRRRLMLGADLARCALLGLVPILSAVGSLHLWELYVLAALTGGFTVIFDVAYLAYMPSLVGRAHLPDANQRLEFSFSTGDIAGPGVGGLLVQLAGAARALALDAASFLFSALMLLLIGRREPPPPPRRELAPLTLGRMGSEIGEGLHVVMANPLLRSLVLSMGGFIFFAHGIDAIFVVFAYRTLHMSPGLLGLVLTATGFGALVGAMSTGRLRRWLGVGPLIVASGLVAGASLLAIPVSLLVAPVPVLFGLGIIRGVAGTVNNVTQVTVRMLGTPDRLHARMNAVFRTIYWGAWPLGELCGGAVASSIGVTPTILLFGSLGLVAIAVTAFTPVGRLRAFPTPVETELSAPSRPSDTAG